MTRRPLKTLARSALTAGCLMASLGAGLAVAQTRTADTPTEPSADQSAHHAAHHTTAASAAPSPAMTDGEVRRVDLAQGKVTLKHGFIQNLDMPAMTMVFRVTDAKLLANLKPGDKVKFVAESRNGALLVTAIEAAR